MRTVLTLVAAAALVSLPVGCSSDSGPGAASVTPPAPQDSGDGAVKKKGKEPELKVGGRTIPGGPKK